VQQQLSPLLTAMMARLAADVVGVPTIIIAGTDADAANLITSDSDERDREFSTGEKNNDGMYAYSRLNSKASTAGIRR